MEFTRNQILFDETCSCDKLYFILSGEIDLFQKSGSPLPADTKKRGKDPLSKADQDLQRLDNNHKAAVLWNNRRVPLATLTEGAIVGFEFFSFKDQLKYEYCATIKSSVSKCIVLKSEVPGSNLRVCLPSARTRSCSNSKCETSFSPRKPRTTSARKKQTSRRAS